MKRLLIVLLLITVCTISSQAQIIDQYSLTATVNQSAVYSTDRITVREPLTGWEIGLAGEKEIISHIKISSGLKLARIRFGMEDVGASHVTYFSFPIDLKAVLPLNFYGQAGLRFDFKIGYKNAREPVVINGSPGWAGDGFASSSDSFVPGWSVGAGKIFSLNGFKPWIEVRYTKDFNSFSGYDGDPAMNKKTGKIVIGIPIHF